MRVDATCPKVFFPVEFLHCSQCVSQYLNVSPHFSTYSAALRSHIFTLLWEKASQHASRRSRFLNEHVVTKTEIGASRVPFQQQRRTPPHSTAGIVVQRNKVPSTTLNQRGLERLSVDQLQHLLMNIWTKYPQIRDLLSDHTMMSQCPKDARSSLALGAPSC